MLDGSELSEYVAKSNNPEVHYQYLCKKHDDLVFSYFLRCGDAYFFVKYLENIAFNRDIYNALIQTKDKRYIDSYLFSCIKKSLVDNEEQATNENISSSLTDLDTFLRGEE